MATRIFEKMSNGKDYIVIAEIPANPRDPQQQQRMLDFAQQKGITNGQLTREQFADYMQEQMQNRGGGRGGPGGGGGPRPPDDNSIRATFNDLDKNHDGVLSGDELPGDLRDNLDRWDTNRDGKIQFEEFREYSLMRYQAQQARSLLPDEEEDKRPVVYDAKHLPPELTRFAPWFSQLDTDRDGQVALYEWKAGGRSLNEFYAYDTNRDGFITVEEVLRYQKKLAASPDAMSSDLSGGLAGMSGFPGMGGPGGKGPGGRGPGGPGGRGPGGPGGQGGPGGPRGDRSFTPPGGGGDDNPWSKQKGKGKRDN
jgi:Ca2+-binding EF-hand superfamily protein